MGALHNHEDHGARRITLVYLLVGVLWIALSDLVVRRIGGGPETAAVLQTVKGWGFVLVTAVVLYVLLRARAASLRASQAALREHQTLLEHITASVPVVIYRMEVRDGRLVPTWVSASVERLLGYTPREALDPGWWFGNLHPDDRGSAASASASLLTSPMLAHEYRFKTKHGGYRWIQDVLCRASEGSGEVLGAWLDVTEKRQAEQAVHEREHFLRRLIENASDTVLVLAADGTVEYASPAVERLTGYTGDEFTGRNVYELIHPWDLQRVRSAFERALRRPGQGVAVEYRQRHRSGSWRHASSVGRALQDGGGPARLVVNSRDVSESRMLEDQVRQAQKFEAIGQLTAGIVHDFNNTLSVVLSNAELVLDELPADLPEASTDVAHIKHAAQSGADMVRKLLAFSRQANIQIVPTDLAAVVRDTQAMVDRIVPPAIATRLVLHEPLPLASADAGAVQQVLLNLATNARDAMADGGQLTIELRPATLDERYADAHPWVVPGDYVELAVTDTGTGMDPGTRARMFEPFFTTKPPGKGTGLGMAMIFGLVKQHGGYVDVESELGRGTTVRVYLPAAPAGSSAAPPAAPSPVRGGTETIVLVEDQEALRRTGQRILEKLGYTVWVAADGAECLTVLELRGEEVDLVISDVQMPRMNGVQAYAELRKRGSTVPFLFSSGEVAPDFRTQYGLADVDFLQKPWTVDEVARAVRRTLDERRG